MVEFAASNHVNISIKMTLFFTDYGFHPCTGIELFETYNSEQKVQFLVVKQIIKKQDKMIKFLQD